MSEPQLRFKEFSGEWENRPLSEIVGRLESGVSVNSEDVAIRLMHEYGILKTSCIANGYFFAHENKKIIPSEIARAKLNPAEDSILVSRMNTPQLVGEVGYVSKSYPNLFVPDRLWLIEVKNKYRDSTKWLSQQLTTKYLKNVLTNIATGTSGSMKNIAQPNFLSIGLCTPEFAEQTKIANFLTAVDEKIAQLTQKSDLLARYKKGVMQKIFSQQLRFKDNDGQDFPDWEVKKFGDVFNFIVTNSFSRELLTYDDGIVKNIHYGDIHKKFKSNFKIENENVPFISDDINISNISEDCYCKEGDLIIADASEDYADIGKSIEIISLNNQKLLAGLHTYIARDLSKKMALGFSGYLMQIENVRLQIKTLATGVSVLGISKGNLAKVNLSVPSKSEQTEIANFLTAIDDKISHNQTQLSTLKQYKQGLLQQLFV